MKSFLFGLFTLGVLLPGAVQGAEELVVDACLTTEVCRDRAPGSVCGAAGQVCLKGQLVQVDPAFTPGDKSKLYYDCACVSANTALLLRAAKKP